ncbi:MAG: aldehyde ferredoxin oxidoreductase family protein [Clostridia bacterium]
MHMLKGYMGKVLLINLAAQTQSDYPWTDADRIKTIGGKIMAAEILRRHIRSDMSAFDDDNWLVVSTGPLTGCGCPSTSRFNISTISPLTGIVTSSNCGGNFGIQLKKAGYDALIITGKANEHTWVEITEDAVTFHNADELWGSTTSQAQEKLGGRSGKLVIGPAGENKVRYAAVISNERCAGRGGVGAVFGDKNLKAVTALGNKSAPVYSRDKLKILNKKWTAQLRSHPLTGGQLPKLGTAGLIAPMQAHSILATKNFSDGRFDGFEGVSGEELAEKYLVKNTGCTSCVIQCTRQVRLDGKVIKGPELETLGLLGPNILNNDMQAIFRWNYELDELGMDTISTAGSIAFAMELNEKGMWDCDLVFGKTDNISATIADIAYRRGIGNELADGSRSLSKKYGGVEFAINSKGMELAAYEPRGAVGQGLGYATANRGGCHLNAGYLVVAEGLGLDIDSTTPHAKAALTIMFQNLMEGISACGSCLFTSYAVLPAKIAGNPGSLLTRIVNAAFTRIGPIVGLLDRFPGIAAVNLPLVRHSKALQLATGMHMTLGRLLRAGERGYNIERLCNITLGQTADADSLPKRLTTQGQTTGIHKQPVPLEVMKKKYYSIRGWKDGAPTARRLRRLGIAEV